MMDDMFEKEKKKPKGLKGGIYTEDSGLPPPQDIDGGSAPPPKKPKKMAEGGVTKAKRYDAGGTVAAPTYPFQPSNISPPASTTTVNVNGTTAATTAPEQQMFSVDTQPMKKGGAVRGWGKARGARKAKVY